MTKENQDLVTNNKKHSEQRDVLESETKNLEHQKDGLTVSLADLFEERRKYGSSENVIGLKVDQIGKYGLIKNTIVQKRIWVMGARGAGKTTLCRSLQAMEYTKGDAEVTIDTSSQVLTYIFEGNMNVVEIFDTRGFDQQKYGITKFFLDNRGMIRKEDLVVVIQRGRASASMVDLITALNETCAHYTVVVNDDAETGTKRELFEKFQKALGLQKEVKLIGPQSFSKMTGEDDFPKLLDKILNCPSSDFRVNVNNTLCYRASSHLRFMNRFFNTVLTLLSLALAMVAFFAKKQFIEWIQSQSRNTGT